MNPGELQSRLDAYLAIRSALGFKDYAVKLQLQDFVKYVIRVNADGPISAQIAFDWACAAKALRSAEYQASRLSTARKFLVHLAVTHPDTEIPERGLLASGRRKQPYIFSQEQIVKLIATALTLRPRRSLRPHTYATLIGLMASTGLRVGEAIRLQIDDVQLKTEPPRILVRETKFYKSRIVPVHPTTADQLRRYAKLRLQMKYAGLTDAFFVSEQGNHVAYRSLRSWFVRATRRLGMQPVGQERPPTLHCLRHTFAVERLTEWCRQGVSVQHFTPNLSVYLGHVRPEESYWYLTATPALLLTASESLQRHLNIQGGEL